MRNNDLCERLKRYSTKCLAERLDPDFADAVKEAADEIEELEKDVDSLGDQVDALYGALPKWIPVEEKLPQDGERVLVTHKLFTRYPVVEILWYGVPYTEEGTTDPYFYFYSTYDDGWAVPRRGITHWMPLLKPPEDGDKDGET